MDESVRKAPVGMLDSGVGGLSVLRRVRALMPGESLIYVADSAHVPYGDKTDAQVRERVFAVARILLDMGIKALVLACNTATAVAVQALRSTFPQLPIVGMEPGVKPGVAQSRRGRVGVLATRRTVDSASFAGLMARWGGGAEVIAQPCPGLADRVENSDLDDPETIRLLAGYLTPLLDRGVDVIVLGCTHYPFLLPLIQRLAGPSVAVIDTGDAVARQLARRLTDLGLNNRGPLPGTLRIFTTGDPERQLERFRRLWGPDALPERLPAPEPVPRPAPPSITSCPP